MPVEGGARQLGKTVALVEAHVARGRSGDDVHAARAGVRGIGGERLDQLARRSRDCGTRREVDVQVRGIVRGERREIGAVVTSLRRRRRIPDAADEVARDPAAVDRQISPFQARARDSARASARGTRPARARRRTSWSRSIRRRSRRAQGSSASRRGPPSSALSKCRMARCCVGMAQSCPQALGHASTKCAALNKRAGSLRPFFAPINSVAAQRDSGATNSGCSCQRPAASTTRTRH